MRSSWRVSCRRPSRKLEADQWSALSLTISNLLFPASRALRCSCGPPLARLQQAALTPLQQGKPRGSLHLHRAVPGGCCEGELQEGMLSSEERGCVSLEISRRRSWDARTGLSQLLCSALRLLQVWEASVGEEKALVDALWAAIDEVRAPHSERFHCVRPSVRCAQSTLCCVPRSDHCRCLRSAVEPGPHRRLPSFWCCVSGGQKKECGVFKTKIEFVAVAYGGLMLCLPDLDSVGYHLYRSCSSLTATCTATVQTILSSTTRTACEASNHPPLLPSPAHAACVKQGCLLRRAVHKRQHELSAEPKFWHLVFSLVLSFFFPSRSLAAGALPTSSTTGSLSASSSSAVVVGGTIQTKQTLLVPGWKRYELSCTCWRWNGGLVC